MSFELPTKRTRTVARTRWSGGAFIVEAMLLLVFIMASFAVFTQLFAESAERANASKDLTGAVAIASTTAERFAADPAGVPSEFFEGDMRVTCKVTPEKRVGGTLYRAVIDVYAREGETRDVAQGGTNRGGEGLGAQGENAVDGADVEPTYTLTTSKYESGV